MQRLGRDFWNGDVVMTPSAQRLHNASFVTCPYDDHFLDLTFLVSCYNEAQYITDTLDTICAAADEVNLTYEIIVTDDCSQDNSPELINSYISSHPEKNILLRINRYNKGWAQNYVDGAFLGKGKYYRLASGDNNEPKESIVTILKSIGEADCIVPCYAPNLRSFNRNLISKIYTFVINFVAGNKVHYYNGQAVHLRHNIMRWHPNTYGFGFQADILCRLITLGFTYKEVPIICIEKRKGKSNALTLRNWFSVLHTISEIIIRRISHCIYGSSIYAEDSREG
jgi:glycosyltransferase involved in cell wall biosynthesis